MINEDDSIPIFGKYPQAAVPENKNIIKDLEKILDQIPNARTRLNFQGDWNNLDKNTQLSMVAKFKAINAMKKLEKYKDHHIVNFKSAESLLPKGEDNKRLAKNKASVGLKRTGEVFHKVVPEGILVNKEKSKINTSNLNSMEVKDGKNNKMKI